MNFETTPERWATVAEAVRERREQLLMTQVEAVAASGGQVGMSTWSHLERGDKSSYQLSKLKAVCRVLLWTGDSVQRIVAGGEPIDSSTQSEELEIQGRVWRIEETVAGLLRRFELLELELQRLEVARQQLPRDPQADPANG